MFKFLHAADVHLDSPLKGLEIYPDAPLEQIRGAARRAFDNLVELAIEEQVAFVLLTGDLYDGNWRDYNTGIYFSNRLGRLRDAGIPVFIISGNHDAASQITRALNLPDNAFLFSHKNPETHRLDTLGVAIHGQSFSSRVVDTDLTRNYPQGDPDLFNIGLLHTSLTGRPGHDPYAPCTLDALYSKGYQYWALGHVHQREEVSRDPWIVYPGNLQGRHIRETGAKGCTLVSVDGGRVQEVQARELDVLRWVLCPVDLEGCERQEALLERVREALERERDTAEGRPLAARLVLQGKTALHGPLHERAAHWQEELRAIAASLGDVWLEKILFRTRKQDRPLEGFDDESPFAALQALVEAFQFPSSQLSELVPVFEQLRSKLPAELISEGDPFSPPEDELTTLKQEVRELLTAKLQQGARDAH